MKSLTNYSITPTPFLSHKVLYLHIEIPHILLDHTLMTIDQQKIKPNRRIKEHMQL